MEQTILHYNEFFPYEKVYVNILHASTTAIQAVFSQAPAVGENFIVTIIAIG